MVKYKELTFEEFAKEISPVVYVSKREDMYLDLLYILSSYKDIYYDTLSYPNLYKALGDRFHPITPKYDSSIREFYINQSKDFYKSRDLNNYYTVLLGDNDYIPTVLNLSDSSIFNSNIEVWYLIKRFSVEKVRLLLNYNMNLIIPYENNSTIFIFKSNIIDKRLSDSLYSLDNFKFKDYYIYNPLEKYVIDDEVFHTLSLGHTNTLSDLKIDNHYIYYNNYLIIDNGLFKNTVLSSQYDKHYGDKYDNDIVKEKFTISDIDLYRLKKNKG